MARESIRLYEVMSGAGDDDHSSVFFGTLKQAIDDAQDCAKHGHDATGATDAVDQCIGG